MRPGESIVLVADCGGECKIPASCLAAASPSVWGERFSIAAEPSDGDVRSYERGMSFYELSSFIGVATLLSPYPTMPELLEKPKRGSIAAHLQVRRLTAALSLSHKYACDGLVKLIAYLVDYHFPPALLPEAEGGALSKVQSLYARARDADVFGSEVCPSLTAIAQWITQSHVDFIIRAQVCFQPAPHMLRNPSDLGHSIMPRYTPYLNSCKHLCFALCPQELFSVDGSDAMLLNDTCLAILAHALTDGLAWSACTRYQNGLHFMHGRVAVVDVRVPEPAGTGELSAVPAAAAVPSTAASSIYTASSTASYLSSGSQARTPDDVFAGATDNGSGSRAPASAPTAGTSSSFGDVDPSAFDNPSANPVYRTTYDPLTASLHLFLEPLVLERSRLAPATIMRLLPLMAPRRKLFVAASRPEDRRHEQGANEAVFREATVLPTGH